MFGRSDIEGELSLRVVAFFPRKLKLSSDSKHTDDFPEFHQATLRNAGDLKTCKTWFFFSLRNPPTFGFEAEWKYMGKVIRLYQEFPLFSYFRF